MSPNPSLPVICIGVGISSLFKALMEPAFNATITDMLSEEDFAKAGGMVQIASNLKILISPAIAGLLLQITTVSTLIIIDILTFFTTIITIVLVKKGMVSKSRKDSKLSFTREMKEGIAAIRGKGGIVAMIVIMTFAVFCIGFVQILIKPLILAFAGEVELGILTTVSALGMLAGSIIISCLKNIKSYDKMLSFGLVGCGIFLALIGVWQNLILIATFGFMMFVFMPAVQIGAEVLVRMNLANEVQGRAFGLISFITQMGYIFAYILSGVISDYIFAPFQSVMHMHGLMPSQS
jgi:MFS family permease